MEKFVVSIQAPFDLVWKYKESMIWIWIQNKPSPLSIEPLQKYDAEL
jgi:hypothetical protein